MQTAAVKQNGNVLSNLVGIENLGPVVKIIYYQNRKMRAEGLDHCILSNGKKTAAYVNLDQIEALIRGGREIQVITYPHGKDLTNSVLASIAARKYRQNLENLPTDELSSRIRNLI